MTTNDINLENALVMFGNAMERLKELPDNSVDSIVTDPPYGLSDNKYVADTIAKWINGERDFIPDSKGFMGKAWDSFVPPPAIWDECLRVLKPGGHLLAFFGSRTQDVGALSIRLAGFEIRDSVAWLYGSGFPKSMDISKAIDKQAGAERKVVSTKPQSGAKFKSIAEDIDNGGFNDPNRTSFDITAPATDAAKQYEGWGTALKPAHEPIVVARKPLSESTVANNVLLWGTGGLNIDASRVGSDKITINGQGNDNMFHGKFSGKVENPERTGRFPANLILSHSEGCQDSRCVPGCPVAELDEQSGVSKSVSAKMPVPDIRSGKYGSEYDNRDFTTERGHNDTGGASRFFYVAKASKKDRNEGLEDLPVKANAEWPQGGIQEGNPRGASSSNFHPTVKPTALMEYLVRLVTPEGGTVLDPFTGSGSTGKAALLNGFKFIGCELTEDYLPIIEGRLRFAEVARHKPSTANAGKKRKKKEDTSILPLFEEE